MGNKKPKKSEYSNTAKILDREVEVAVDEEKVKEVEAIVEGMVDELDSENESDVVLDTTSIPTWNKCGYGEMVGYGYTYITFEDIDRAQQVTDIIEAHLEQPGVIVVLDPCRCDDLNILGDIHGIEVNEEMRSIEVFADCIDEDGTFYPDALKIALHYLYKSVKHLKIDTIMVTTEKCKLVKNLAAFKNIHLPLTEVVLQYNYDLSTNIIIEAVPEQEEEEKHHIPLPNKKDKKKEKKKDKSKDKKKKDKKKKKK